VYLQRHAGQAYKPNPQSHQHRYPCWQERGQQYGQAGAATGVPRREGMSVKSRVEPQALSRWALSPEEPLEGGGGQACDQRPEKHAAAKAPPGRASPGESCSSTEQPQRAISAVSGGECQQAQ
jgi:hypothetical protein